jgi:uncharacterized membrane protein
MRLSSHGQLTGWIVVGALVWIPGGRLRHMSLDFAVAQFDGENTAVERYSAARDRAGDEARWMREVGFVEHQRGGLLRLRGTFAGHYVDVDESDHVSQRGAGEGAAAGGLIGVLLGPPGIAVGFLLGLLIGAERGPSSDTEAEPQALADQLRSAVPRSSSAVVLIADAPDVDDMLAAVGESAQRTSRQTLTTDQAAELQASLSAAPPAAPGSSARDL